MKAKAASLLVSLSFLMPSVPASADPFLQIIAEAVAEQQRLNARRERERRERLELERVAARRRISSTTEVSEAPGILTTVPPSTTTKVGPTPLSTVIVPTSPSPILGSGPVPADGPTPSGPVVPPATEFQSVLPPPRRLPPRPPPTSPETTVAALKQRLETMDDEPNVQGQGVHGGGGIPFGPAVDAQAEAVHRWEARANEVLNDPNATPEQIAEVLKAAPGNTPPSAETQPALSLDLGSLDPEVPIVDTAGGETGPGTTLPRSGNPLPGIEVYPAPVTAKAIEPQSAPMATITPYATARFPLLDGEMETGDELSELAAESKKAGLGAVDVAKPALQQSPLPTFPEKAKASAPAVFAKQGPSPVLFQNLLEALRARSALARLHVVEKVGPHEAPAKQAAASVVSRTASSHESRRAVPSVSLPSQAPSSTNTSAAVSGGIGALLWLLLRRRAKRA